MHRLPACFIAVLAAFTAVPASAAIFTVGSGAGCTHATIQAAIDAADAAGSSGADEIRISAGPYTGQALTMHIAAAQGAVSLVGGFATCASATPSAGVRTVVGGRSSGADPVLRISDTADATLRNLEIRDATSGGGLVVETNAAGSAASLVELVDTLVVHNGSVLGGGVLVANYNSSTPQDRLRLRLSGSSEVAFNLGRARGGGIYCNYATVTLRDTAGIQQNAVGEAGFAGSHDGGGIYADDCRLDVTSPSLTVLYRNVTNVGRGGGLYLTGVHGSADFYSVAAGMTPFVRDNRATDGGGIAIAGGAQVRMFGGGGLLDNTADASGGAVWIAPGSAAGVDTRFLAQSALDGAPEAAVACVSPELCGIVRGNRAVSPSGAAGPGAVIAIEAGSGGTAHAKFRGVRIDHNDGYSMTTQGAARSQVVFDGSLVIENQVSGGFGAFAVSTSDGALVLSASTVANNMMATAGATVFGTPTTCDPGDDEVGIHLRRSVIWQPGHSLLFTLFDPPQATCFEDLLANDFGWLGTASDRIVADPAFENVAAGDYRLSATSPALDFAPAHAGDATLDDGARVIDLPAITNLFGAQDLGAFERTYSPTVTASVAGPGGTITPPSQSVVYGQAAHLGVLPLGGWHAILPLGGTCVAGTLDGANYTTGPVTTACSVIASFIHATTIALASSAEPSVYGQSLTFTATLASASPTGSVTFRDGANVLGTAPISGASANFTTSALGVGAHSITAQYAGDAQNTAAISPPLVQSVNRAATTTTMLATTPIHYGQSASIIAMPQPVSPGAGTPTGTITVLVGLGPGNGSGSCTIALPAAACALVPLNVTGLLTLSATYSGDANFAGSAGTQTLEVTPQFVGGALGGVTAEGLVLRLLIDGEEVGTAGASAGGTTFQFTQPVPVGASYQVNVAAHPPGLFCIVSSGSGTMPAADVHTVSVACSDEPHAILALAVDDGLDYARYGQTLTYTVTLANGGNADATDVAVAASSSAGLDASALTWTCLASGSGAGCAPGGAGGLSDSADLPVGASVTYTIAVPVRTTTGEPRVRFEINANAGEATHSDSDTLVLLRDGFEQ